jgi:deazaflavin-dependent oxidoreductase (nitroreductase family)
VAIRASGPYETPVAWFAGDGGERLVVASGGGEQDPDWYRNLVARPDEAAIELAGGERVEVRPEPLAGAEREAAWARMAAAQPRTATYQAKTERRYPVVRLTAR